MNNIFNDLSYLIGEEVEIRNKDYFDIYPDRIVVVDEYPKHLLLEMTFTGSVFGIRTGPRTVRRRINKAAMFCGDMRIYRKSTNKLLAGDVIKVQTEVKPGKGIAGGYGNSKYLQEEACL